MAAAAAALHSSPGTSRVLPPSTLQRRDHERSTTVLPRAMPGLAGAASTDHAVPLVSCSWPGELDPPGSSAGLGPQDARRHVYRRRRLGHVRTQGAAPAAPLSFATWHVGPPWERECPPSLHRTATRAGSCPRRAGSAQRPGRHPGPPSSRSMIRPPGTWCQVGVPWKGELHSSSSSSRVGSSTPGSLVGGQEAPEAAAHIDLGPQGGRGGLRHHPGEGAQEPRHLRKAANGAALTPRAPPSSVPITPVLPEVYQGSMVGGQSDDGAHVGCNSRGGAEDSDSPEVPEPRAWRAPREAAERSRAEDKAGRERGEAEAGGPGESQRAGAGEEEASGAAKIGFGTGTGTGNGNGNGNGGMGYSDGQGSGLEYVVKRVIWGAGIGCTAFGALLRGGWAFACLLGVLCGVGAWEFFGLVRRRCHARGLVAPGIPAALVCSLACAAMPVATLASGGQVIRALQVGAGALAAVLLLQPTRPRSSEVSSLAFGLLYCGLFATFWVKLRCGALSGASPSIPWPTPGVVSPLQSFLVHCWPPLLGGGTPVVTDPARWSLGLAATFLGFAGIIAADTGAYMGGKILGRTPLIDISPNKTWEGAFSGLCACQAVTFWVAKALLWPAPPVWTAALATVVFLAALFGDLSESMLKRDAGVKDAGRLIPGHGGVLDRTDSYIFTGLTVFSFVRFVLPRILL